MGTKSWFFVIVFCVSL